MNYCSVLHSRSNAEFYLIIQLCTVLLIRHFLHKNMRDLIHFSCRSGLIWLYIYPPFLSDQSNCTRLPPSLIILATSSLFVRNSPHVTFPVAANFRDKQPRKFSDDEIQPVRIVLLLNTRMPYLQISLFCWNIS